MKRILALDGALGAFSVAIVGGGSEVADQVDGRRALERGLALVDEMLVRSATRLEAFDALAVGIGPGGFSGLRIALGYAKGLALAAGRPLTGVSSYDALEPAGLTPPVVTVVRLKPGHVCARLRLAGTPGPAVWCGLEADVGDALAAALAASAGDPIACCGAGQGVAERLGERGFIVLAQPLPDSPAALWIARLAALRPRTAFGSPHALRPDYGPEPQFVQIDRGETV